MRGHAHLVAGYAPRSSLLQDANVPQGSAVADRRRPCFTSPAVSVLTDMRTATAVPTVVVVHLWSGRPTLRLWRSVRMMLLFLMLIAAYQWCEDCHIVSWQAMAAIVATALASNLMNATSPVDELRDGAASVVRLLERFGADADRFSLTVALMLRSVPFVIGAFDDVLDTVWALGLERNLLPLPCMSSLPRWPTPGRPERHWPPGAGRSRRNVV